MLENKEVPHVINNAEPEIKEPVVGEPPVSGVSLPPLGGSEKKSLAVGLPQFSFCVSVLKPVAIVLFMASLVLGFYFVSALDSDNKYFSLFGVSENTQKMHKRLSAQSKKLKAENQKLEKSNSDLSRRLNSGDFFTQQVSVDQVRDDMLDWIDRKNEEDELVYGMINSVDRLVTYFNSARYQHPILSVGNTVEMSKINIDRKGASFNVVVSNIFGKAFYLATELVEMMNAFPTFKNGSVQSFTKKLNKDGYYEMQFGLKLGLQVPGEKDADDYRFQEYVSSLAREIEIEVDEGPQVGIRR